MKKRISLLFAIILFSGCIRQGSVSNPAEVPQTTSSPPPPEMLPALQPITLENAGKIQLLRTMKIPDYSQGEISQCSIAFSPDGHLLVGACGKNKVPVWEVKSGLIRHLLYETPQHIVACDFSPDDVILACGGFDRTITFWNSKTGEKISDFGSHVSPVWELDFNPDGKRVVSCGLSDDVRLWDVARSETMWSYTGGQGYLSVSLHPSGNTVAYGSRWGNAGVLDAMTGKSILKLDGPGNPVGDVSFSPSGKMLAAGTDDNRIYLWNTNDYQLVATLVGHRHYVNGVSFSPDETLLASGSHDRTVGIWDIVGGRLLRTLDGHTDVVLRVIFNPDGTLVASISWDGTVRLWGVPR